MQIKSWRDQSNDVDFNEALEFHWRIFIIGVWEDNWRGCILGTTWDKPLQIHARGPGERLDYRSGSGEYPINYFTVLTVS